MTTDHAKEILEKIASRVGVPASSLDPTKPFISYGLDSIALIDLKSFIHDRHGVDVPMDFLLNGATIASLDRLLPSTPSRPAAKPAPAKPSPVPALDAPTFSLFFFASDPPKRSGQDIYRLVFDCARFADEHGFEAVWTPERHFHEFGGNFPNPGVLGAALAMATRRIRIRAGSVVAPLSSPLHSCWASSNCLSNSAARCRAARVSSTTCCRVVLIRWLHSMPNPAPEPEHSVG